MEIKIDNNIGNFEAYLISPEGANLGLITNIISLDYIRVQIREKHANGYKIYYKGGTGQFLPPTKDEWVSLADDYEEACETAVKYCLENLI